MSSDTTDIKDQIQESLGEARMVLPGIQALFGFQLIAVFNHRFSSLTEFEQDLHFAALFAVALSAALIMTPAAYHRQTHLNCDARDFLKVSSVCSTAALLPLMLSMCLDVYLVGRLITATYLAPSIIASVLFLVLSSLWFVFPRVWRPRRGATDESAAQPFHVAAKS